jgi:hypothetical protein
MFSDESTSVRLQEDNRRISMNVDRKVGDVVVGTANADGKNYVCILTEIDHVKFPSIETYDVGVCLRGLYLGKLIRLDNLRVVLSAERLLKLAEEKGGFDLATPPETPDELLPESERAKRREQKLLARIEALEKLVKAQ